jgi:hypothetical protein
MDLIYFNFFCIARLIKTYYYDHVVFCNNVYGLQTNKVVKGASKASRPLMLVINSGDIQNLVGYMLILRSTTKELVVRIVL